MRPALEESEPCTSIASSRISFSGMYFSVMASERMFAKTICSSLTCLPRRAYDSGESMERMAGPGGRCLRARSSICKRI